MQSTILEYVEKFNHVTFVELHRILGAESEGDVALTTARDPNIVLWAGMSVAFNEAVQALLVAGKVHFKPCSSILVYLADGGGLTLPLAKSVLKKGYKKPHWAAVTICAGAEARA